MTTLARFNSEIREKAIGAARMGMSLEGVAHVCGVSRMTLWNWRKADPEFNANLMAALAQFELGLLSRFGEASDAGEAGMMAATSKMLAQRFPQRHGVDPRIRLDVKAAQEGYEEDLNDPQRNATSDTTAAVVSRLVDRMLKEDEGDDA